MHHDLEMYAASQAGSRHTRNEDRILVARLAARDGVRAPHVESPLQALLAVADGMGGRPDGAHASAIAVRALEETVRSAFAKGEPTMPLRLLGRGFARCENEVQAATSGGERRAAPGTTLTAALVLWPKVYVAHVGSSRCYLLRDGGLIRLTRDQTVAQRLVDAGALDEDQAARSRWRFVLEQALGTEEVGVRPDLVEVEMRPGDALCLCSDGLTRALDEDELRDLLDRDDSAAVTCCRLVERALSVRGTDDVSVAVARYTTPSDHESAALVGRAG